MRRVVRAAILVGLATAFVSAGPRLSSAVTLSPVEDTYVTVHGGLGGPDSNHGPDTSLWLIGTGGFVSVPLFQFDLSPFAGETLAGDAVLSLAVLSTHSGGAVGQNINLNLIPVAWDEGTVTWNSFGGLPGTNLANLNDPSISPGDTLVFVIPEATVQAWIDSPPTNFGVLLSSQTSTAQQDVVFGSREGTATLPAQLSFDTVAEPGTALLLGSGLAALGAARGRIGRTRGVSRSDRPRSGKSRGK